MAEAWPNPKERKVCIEKSNINVSKTKQVRSYRMVVKTQGTLSIPVIAGYGWVQVGREHYFKININIKNTNSWSKSGQTNTQSPPLWSIKQHFMSSFLQISFCQKITNTNCKYREVAQNTCL